MDAALDAAVDAAVHAQPSFLDQLIQAGLFVPTGVAGLYGHSAVYEAVASACEALFGRLGAQDRPEAIRFPPAMPRAQLEASGYMKSFPHLAGTVHAFCGGDSDHRALLGRIEAGEDWAGGQAATEIALTPAACYPLYPMMAAQGPLPRHGRDFDVQGFCFRHEPSPDPARLQLFRMREFVRAGTPEDVQAFRSAWIERASDMAARLGLPHQVEIAHDPFFGRSGLMLRASQREQALKYELLIPITDGRPTACFSFNYHRDGFAQAWGLALEDGSPAHSACVGMGVERIVLALFRRHGLDPERWPARVRRALWGGRLWGGSLWGGSKRRRN